MKPVLCYDEFPFKDKYYVTHKELIYNYELYEKYNHKCSKCQGEPEIIAYDKIDLESNILKCPHCKCTLNLTSIGMWD